MCIGGNVGFGGVGEGDTVGSGIGVDGGSSRDAVAVDAVLTGIGDEEIRNTHPGLSKASTTAHKTRLIPLPFIIISSHTKDYLLAAVIHSAMLIAIHSYRAAPAPVSSLLNVLKAQFKNMSAKSSPGVLPILSMFKGCC